MSDFYERQYGRHTSDGRTNTVAAFTASALQALQVEEAALVEVGCGDCSSLAAILQTLESTHGIARDAIRATGWDVSETGVQAARTAGFEAEVRDVTRAGMMELEGGVFDVAIFMEVLEHVVDTGQTMRNLHHLLKPDGFLVITTPNLAAWYNRVLLLIGNQPHMTEVSFEPHRFGNRIFERLLGEKPGEVDMAGHLRVFTYKALREFIEYHGFDIVRASGIASHGDRISRTVAKLWPGGAGDIGILARKRG